MINLQTIAFILFAIGAFGWIRALIIERNKWRDAFFTEHRIRIDAEIEGGLVYEKPKRKNDEIDLKHGQAVEVAIPMGIDANGQMQLKTMTAYYRHPRVSDDMPEERPEPFQSNKSYK